MYAKILQASNKINFLSLPSGSLGSGDAINLTKKIIIEVENYCIKLSYSTHRKLVKKNSLFCTRNKISNFFQSPGFWWFQIKVIGIALAGILLYFASMCSGQIVSEMV